MKCFYGLRQENHSHDNCVLRTSRVAATLNQRPQICIGWLNVCFQYVLTQQIESFTLRFAPIAHIRI